MSTEITINQDQIDINVDTTVITIESPTGGYPLPSSVYSVFGRVGNVVAQEGDYTLTQLGGVTITNPLSGQALVYNGTSWVNNTETYTGTVTSVNMSVPTGLTISGNPITTAGTLALGLASGYSIPTTANQANWTTAYNDSIVSAAVTGVQTKTLTLNQQDGGTITASWSDYDTAPVTSVFGRTGAITAESGDYNTLQVTENTNLYFTNQRARFAISGDATSGVVYSNTTGIIALDDIPNTSLLNDSVTINGSTVALGGSTSFTTSAVAEGTNLYYTQARFNSAFAAKSTTDLAEGTNLYFTMERAQSAITGTSPISVTSGNVSITQASGSTNGYLSSADWTAFNAKQAALTFSSPLVNTSGTISIPAATSLANGYLTSTDWTTFNSKQAALSGTGFVKINGTTISYDNSTYLTTIEGIAAGGELSGTYASPSLVNSAVTGKVLTGVNITGGSISASDSILTAFGKVQNQINGLVGGSIYQGTWNASTNTPALASGVGTKGYYYIVSVAGSTNLDGITDWNVGDWAIYDGTAWQQVDNTDAVVSVNGFTGAVSLTTSNISEGTNLYYTDARARGSVSAGTGISYNSTSGVITNSAPDQTVSLTGAGTTSISGTYPNFTITSNDQYVGTVTSVGITESAAALTITGSPVTTSGNINIGFAGSSTQYVAGDGSLVPFPTVVTQAQNLVTEVYNNTGATLTKGTVVYINGGQGNLPTVTKAQANSDATSAQTYGVVRTDITNNNNGYITVVGNLDNIDTQAYAAGTQLYLSGTTAGAWTDVKPYAPIHLVYVGIVVRSHPTQGVVEIRIQNGYEMDELHNVSAQNPNNGDILQYVSSTSLWTKTAGTTSAIAEGTNLYYTDARSRGAISLTTTGNNGASTYNSTTGVLNVPTYTLAGLGGINLTSLSATSPLLYNNTTGVFSIQQSSGSQAGFLSAADWTTFNSKQNALTNPVTGTGTTNYLPKFTGASTIGNSQIQDDGTSVGIGGSPNASYKLAVTGASLFSSSITANGVMSLGNDGTYGATYKTLGLTGNTNGTHRIFAGTGDNLYIAAASGRDIVFWTDGSSATKASISTTGAATFSSSVTTGGTMFINGDDGSLYQRAATANAAVYWDIRNSANVRRAYIGFGGTSSTLFDIANSDGGDTRFLSAGVERMRITSSGNVGIGTSDPNTPLGATTKGMVINGGSAGDVQFRLQNNNTGATGNDGVLLSLAGDNSSYLWNYENAPFIFGTNSTERMRITSGGSVAINNPSDKSEPLSVQGFYDNWTTAAWGYNQTGKSYGSLIYAGTNSADYSLYIANVSGAQVYLAVRGDGNIRTNSTMYNNTTSGSTRTLYVGTDYFLGGISSVRASKKNIENISNVDWVYQLNPVTFNYRKKDDEGNYTEETYEDLNYGLIAEDTAPIADFLINYNDKEDGTKEMVGIEYSRLITPMLKAIQELNAKITALENK